MEKISIAPANLFCPQALYLYGTYREDGSPNFGLFTWFTYCWDGAFGAVACIETGKMTHDRILATGVFSANLVTEPLLPLADYLGNNASYATPGKMDIPIEIAKGAVLPVPVLEDSPWVFELAVDRSIPLDGNTLFLCKIRNVLAARELTDASLPAPERLRRAAPVVWTGAGPYFSLNPQALGKAGDWKDAFGKAR